MNINMKFGIWCARKCLHLWEPSTEVIEWFDDPENRDKATKAAEATQTSITEYAKKYTTMWTETSWTIESSYSVEIDATLTAYTAIADAETYTIDCKSNEAMYASQHAARYASKRAARALKTTEDALKHEFVSTFTNNDLKTIDPEWIDHITAEIFRR